MASTVGQRIRLLRVNAGMSGNDLAKSLGVTGMAVSKWERDATLPGSNKLLGLSRALSTTIDFLLCGFDGNAELLLRGVDLLQRDGEITASRAAELKRHVLASVGEIE